MSTLAVTNLKHESASGNNIVLASDGTATFAEIITASKGIAFPATQVSSANANTLDDYEEGEWTPTDVSGAGLTFAAGTLGIYTKIGRQVTAWGRVAYPSTANGNNASIGGLPFTSLDNQANRGGVMLAFKTESTLATIIGPSGGTDLSPRDGTGNTIPNSTMSSDVIFFAITYNI